ncbi:MAG: HEAT repeat domain-containing protein [Myxococcales bacterium]|nr:HEAT repeat domain-containing protein [Myxococcales bacterium]
MQRRSPLPRLALGSAHPDSPPRCPRPLRPSYRSLPSPVPPTSVRFTVLLPPSHTITLEAALRDTGSTDLRVRVAAANALGDVTEPEERAAAVTALLPLADDGRPEVRCHALMSLGHLGDERALEPLIERLGDGDAEVRQCAAIALGALGDARAFEPLVRGLKEGPPDLRMQAAASLAELAPGRAYDLLIPAIRDEDAEVRATIAQLLGDLEDRRAAGWLADLLEDNSIEVRFEAASSLAVFRDARGLDVLIATLDDGDRAHRAYAPLAELGDARAADAVAKRMRRFFLARAERILAAGTLLTLAPTHEDAPRAREVLSRAEKSRDPYLRGLAESATERHRQDRS